MNSKIPENLAYTAEHEWAKIEHKDTVIIGITDFAQSALGDIVYVELPEVGKKLSKGSPFGVVESIKSVSDLYSPITGEVIEVNSELESQPELCNKDAYSAWMIRVRMANPSEAADLLSSKQYAEHCTNA